MKCSEENVPQYLDEIDDLVSEDKHNTYVNVTMIFTDIKIIIKRITRKSKFEVDYDELAKSKNSESQ